MKDRPPWTAAQRPVEEDLDATPLTQQGDLSMYTDENIAKRMVLAMIHGRCSPRLDCAVGELILGHVYAGSSMHHNACIARQLRLILNALPVQVAHHLMLSCRLSWHRPPRPPA